MITKDQFDQLGITLYYEPSNGQYFAGHNGVAHGIDRATVDHLKSIGVPVDRMKPGEYSSSGGSTVTAGYLDNALAQVTEKQNQEKEASRVQQFNAFIEANKNSQNPVVVPQDLVDPNYKGSPYVVAKGTLTTQDAFDKTYGGPDVVGSTAWHDAQAAMGKEIKVPVGSGFSYIPTGSAGEANLPNIGTQNTANMANSGQGLPPAISNVQPDAPAPAQQAPQPAIDPVLAQFNQQVAAMPAPQTQTPQTPPVPATPAAPQAAIDPVLAQFNQQVAAMPAPSAAAPSPVSVPASAPSQPVAPDATAGQIPVQVGSGTAYIPAGSAAAQLQAGYDSGAVSTTNPEQQFAASMTGNNVSDPGITPVAPTPAPAALATDATATPATPAPLTPTTPPQATNANNGFYKDAQGNVFEVGTNRHITLQEFQQRGLNIDHINTQQGQTNAPTGQIQPPAAIPSGTPDATIGQNGQAPAQVGGKFGTQNFGRIGNDVYEIMSDGSQRKVSEAEFLNVLKAKGLNLDALPQISPAGLDSNTPAPTNPDINPDGTPKTPSNFVSDYTGIVKELGLTSIKSRFDEIQKQYSDLQSEKADKISDIQMNPWLSEGLRSKQVQNLNSKYEQKEADLTDQMKLYDSLYQEGLAEAKYLTSGMQEDRNKLLELAMRREEAQATLDQREFENQLDLANLTLAQKKLALDQYRATSDVSGTGGQVSSGGAYDALLNTILGSGKFTKDQVQAVKNAINSGQDPVSVIKNQAKNIMGQTEANTLGKFEVAKSSLIDLSNALKAFYAAGGDTGVFTGNYEKTINKLGQVNDPRLVSLATQIAANLQIYRNAVSGTAYSEQEGADIASIFPGINKSQGLNEAILSGRMAAFDSTINGTYRNVLGSAYDQLLPKQSPPSTAPPSTPPSFSVQSIIGSGGSSDYSDYLKAIGK